jgi:hypothetical protein
MSIPAWVPMLDLMSHLELGPNCPDEEDCPTCNQCEQKGECRYATSDHS